jgi:hypothetical protein
VITPLFTDILDGHHRKRSAMMRRIGATSFVEDGTRGSPAKLASGAKYERFVVFVTSPK